jgi:hypothetical protein
LGLGLSYKPRQRIEFYGNISQNYRSVTFNDIRTVSPSQVIAENIPSLKLHTSLGFKQEGTFRDHYIAEGVFQNVVHFGILKSDWQSTAS